MPYVESGGVRIHYQVEGAGSALVLQHGFTDSLASWHEFGYVSALAPDYKLILLDARGRFILTDARHQAGEAVSLRLGQLALKLGNDGHREALRFARITRRERAREDRTAVEVFAELRWDYQAHAILA